MANKYFYRIENGAHELIGEGEILTFAEIRGPHDIVKLLSGLRPEVLKFALIMEEKLRKHDKDRGPKGWVGDDPWPLYERLDEEWGIELYDAIKKGVPSDIAREAADVANFAMMIADVMGGLK